MRHRGAFIAASVVAATAMLAGQQQAPPIFRSGVEAVQVDVYVTDKDDQPVSGLTADDFEVLENGRPQPITTFAPVNIPVERSERLPLGAEPDVRSNNQPPGHVYLFILGGTTPEMALRSRHLMQKFLDDHFGDNDVGAVITGRTYPGDRQDFTNNRRLLMAAVNRFAGDSLDRVELIELMEMMGRVPGGRKVVVWFGGPGFDPFTLIDYHGGVLSRADEDAHAAMAAAARANIRFYLVDPEGLATGFGLEERMNYRMLAEMTGGFATVGTNKFDEAFERIVRETSTYYVLGFNSTDQARTGRYVQLQVRVKRPGLVVKSRTGYLEQMRYSRRRTGTPPANDPPAMTAEAALANPLASDGAGMRVTAVPYRNAGGKATVVLVTDLDGSGLSFVEKNGAFSTSLEVRHLAMDVNHKIYPEFQHRSTITLDARGHQRVTATGLRVVSEFELPKGRYQVRVASSSGERNGSVVYDVEVPDFSDDPLTMSGVSIASLAAPDTVALRPGISRRTNQKSKQCRYQACTATVILESTLAAWTVRSSADDTPLLRDALPAPPTTAREFASSATLALYAEVYDNSGKPRKDPPHTIGVTSSVHDVEGRVVREVSDRRSATSPRLASGGHGFTIAVPLEGLAPGEYVLRMAASSSRHDEHVAHRVVPIRVK